MTFQSVAHKLLADEGKPLSSRELARIALARGLVSSNARDPIESLAQTLEKTIRVGTYNDPELAFVFTSQGRMIGLPGWGARPPGVGESGGTGPEGAATGVPAGSKGPEWYGATMAVHIPDELVERIKLAAQARIGATFADTVARLLRLGLAAATEDIKKGIRSQIEDLERQQLEEEP